MCNHCGGKGMIKVCYHGGEPTEYAVCLCPAARWFRDGRNANKQTGYYGWQVWAAQQQIDPARIALLEELFDDRELHAMGFGPAPMAADEEGLIAAGRTRKVKL